ncbi:hypothetical protein AB0B31_31395 [Catellatospora citrea]|uniref:hypothetical protein n=1 Tax=Catellatospora citrea TaxID=53366 RepID=UPI0033E31FDF
MFLFEDLADSDRSGELAERDLNALQAVADWTRTFVIEPTRISAGRGGYARSVPSDWTVRKFFLDGEENFAIWARRFGESAATALAEELRQTNWRQRHLAST